MSNLDRITQSVCGCPGIRRSVLTLDELQVFLLGTPLPILLNGMSWEVKSKRLCPSIYEVWLKEKDKQGEHE